MSMESISNLYKSSREVIIIASFIATVISLFASLITVFVMMGEMNKRSRKELTVKEHETIKQNLKYSKVAGIILLVLTVFFGLVWVLSRYA